MNYRSAWLSNCKSDVEGRDCQQPVHHEDQLWLSPWRASTPYPLAEPVTPGN
jgi:hypothetical protein